MTLTDIIELAKQGYKPGDIKELIALSNESELNNVNQGEAPEDGSESDYTTQEDSKPTETLDNDDSVDYKAMYEAEHSKLLNAQKNNLNQNINSNTKSDEDIINDLFMNLK